MNFNCEKDQTFLLVLFSECFHLNLIRKSTDARVPLLMSISENKQYKASTFRVSNSDSEQNILYNFGFVDMLIGKKSSTTDTKSNLENVNRVTRLELKGQKHPLGVPLGYILLAATSLREYYTHP